MEIIITEWALDSYIDLKHRQAFTDGEYRQTIRPDAERLKNFPTDPVFQNQRFWSPTTDRSGNRIPDGYKMKWHNMGNGRIQLRLPVGIFSDAVLFEAYIKENEKQEKRRFARFKTHLQLFRQGRFTQCGRLP